MPSAFNLSTLVAMQDQRVEQASVHFWRCQLTSESPRFDWNPDAKAAGGDKEKDKDHASEDIDDDSDIITRHLLHVTGCVLGPKAEGIHLVTVRTRSYQQQQPAAGEPAAGEPEPCPILCMDAGAQRTLALGHEFVLEPSKQAGGGGGGSFCAFELAEGSGPVWLTGTHRVHRVVPASGAGDFEEDEEDEEAAEESEDEEEEAGAGEEEEEDIAEESEAEEEEEDDDEELIEEVKPAKKGKGRQPQAPAASKQKPGAQKPKSQQTAAAKQQRKRAKPDS